MLKRGDKALAVYLIRLSLGKLAQNAVASKILSAKTWKLFRRESVIKLFFCVEISFSPLQSIY